MGVRFPQAAHSQIAAGYSNSLKLSRIHIRNNGKGAVSISLERRMPLYLHAAYRVEYPRRPPPWPNDTDLSGMMAPLSAFIYDLHIASSSATSAAEIKTFAQFLAPIPVQVHVLALPPVLAQFAPTMSSASTTPRVSRT